VKNYLYEEIFDEAPEAANTQPATEENDALFDRLFDERCKETPSFDARNVNPSAAVEKVAREEWDAPLAKSALRDMKGKGARIEKKKNASGEMWVYEYDATGGLLCGYVE
jgi:hypothetical protein